MHPARGRLCSRRSAEVSPRDRLRTAACPPSNNRSKRIERGGSGPHSCCGKSHPGRLRATETDCAPTGRQTSGQGRQGLALPRSHEEKPLHLPAAGVPGRRGPGHEPQSLSALRRASPTPCVCLSVSSHAVETLAIELGPTLLRHDCILTNSIPNHPTPSLVALRGTEG